MFRVLCSNGGVVIRRVKYSGVSCSRKMSKDVKEKSLLSKPLVQLLVGGGLAVGAGYAYSKYTEYQSNEGSEEPLVTPAPGLMLSGGQSSTEERQHDTSSSAEQKTTEESSSTSTTDVQVQDEPPNSGEGRVSTKVVATVTLPLIVLIAAWFIVNQK